MSDKQTIPIGLCQCGCGQATKRSKKTNAAYGHVAGQPVRFIAGHNRRTAGPLFIEDPETHCWIWQKALTAGYGCVRINGKSLGAHRAYYEELIGPIPDSLHLDHLCRNPACVNPGHLEPVTNAENARRGARARLTADDAKEIAARRGGATGVGLAKEFDVSSSTIYQIWHGKIWADVTGVRR